MTIPRDNGWGISDDDPDPNEGANDDPDHNEGANDDPDHNEGANDDDPNEGANDDDPNKNDDDDDPNEGANDDDPNKNDDDCVSNDVISCVEDKGINNSWNDGVGSPCVCIDDKAASADEEEP